MKFNASIVAAILAATITAAPLEVRQETQDWEVTRIDISMPSGRPGSSPDATIKATVYDPNVPIEVGCEARWLYGEGCPAGQEYACNNGWTMTLLEGSGEYDEPMEIKLTVSSGTAQATGAFKRGEGEALHGTCAAGGGCAWYLNPANGPFKLQPS